MEVCVLKEGFQKQRIKKYPEGLREDGDKKNEGM